jgi:hypothetical protein
MSQRLTTHRTPPLLGYTRKGKPIFAIMGGADDDGNGSEGSEGDGSGDGSGDGDGDEGEGEGGDEGGDGGGATVSPEEFEALKRRMQAADRRASAAEAKVKDYEKKDQSELEQAQSAAEEAKGEVETLQSENQELKAQVAFLQQDKHKFINPKAALRLAKDYFADHADDDGNVDMDAVLKQVAKDYPELLVKEDKDEDGDGDKGGKGTGQSASGSPNNGKRQQKGGVDKAALRKKYSALRR